MLKRAKRRYLALEMGQVQVSSQGFMDALWKQVVKLYGEYGASRAGLALIDYDEERCYAIIRVAAQALDMVKTALASMMAVDSTPVAVHVLTVSGTLKSLRRKVNK